MIAGGILFLLGSVLRWGGLILLFRSIYCLTRMYLPAPLPEERSSWQKSFLFDGVLGALGVIFSGAFLAIRVTGWKPANLHAGTINLPLVWFVLPLVTWLILGCLVGAGVCFAQFFAEPSQVVRQNKIKNALGWIAAGIAFLAIQLFDKDAVGKGPIVLVYKGYVPIHWTVAIGFVVLAVAAIFAMAAAANAARARGWAKIAVIHAMLLTGSILFALPFLWLLVTSFKEDQDMSSAHGIIWIPKVTQTRPYFDPNDPMYEGRAEGMSIVGDVQSKNPDGTWTINVIHPSSIAGRTETLNPAKLKLVPKDVNIVSGTYKGTPIVGFDAEDLPDGSDKIIITSPPQLKNQSYIALQKDVKKVRHVGLDWKNYPDALDYLPPSTHYGLTYLENTLILVVLNVVGTILSSSIVAYAFSRMRFPGKNFLFALVLSTMMLPGAVTMLPQFLIFRSLGWIDTLKPLWVPAFFASAFNIFLLRQFFMQIPMELEDAAKIDGCTYLRTFWKVMIPQIKPALAVIGIWTFMGTWGDIMGPLIYISSPEHMPITYALALYNGDHGGEYGLLMAFTVLTILPVLLLFFFAQKYFIEGVTLSGLGGR